MKPRTILVVGSLNMDEIVRIPRLPMLGETLLGAGSLKLVAGGKGANQAVAMARLGAAVTMVGRVGTDPFGGQLIEALHHDGIDTRLIAVDQEEASGVAFIFLTPDGDNAIVVASGANMRVGQDVDQMEHVYALLGSVQALVLQLEIPLPTVQLLIEAGHKAGVLVVFNVAPAQPLPKELLQQVSVLIVNESEASLLSGQRVESLEDAQIVGKVLHSYGIPTVVVTLGARGAILVTDDTDGKVHTMYQAAPKVQVVDTTAAGDCFTGALAVALGEGKPLDEAAAFANAAAALSVTKAGAQPSLPNRYEVEEFLAAP